MSTSTTSTNNLFKCIRDGDTYEALAIIATCDDIDFTSKNHYYDEKTPLFYAYSYRNYTVVLAIIKTRKCNLNDVDSYNTNILMVACCQKRPDIMLEILKQKQQNGEILYNDFVFYWACYNKLYQIVYILLTNDIDNSEYKSNNVQFCYAIMIINFYCFDYNKIANKLREILIQ